MPVTSESAHSLERCVPTVYFHFLHAIPTPSTTSRTTQDGVPCTNYWGALVIVQPRGPAVAAWIGAEHRQSHQEATELAP